ncbi:MAG: hypothetical protein NXY57DRAFT_898320 [Lentinula lateritia]|nr:MAG: hypothetical protein NXY57DRAFT_898320 [Lentinula lateritia]
MFQWIKLSLASFLLVFLLPGLAANTTHPTSSNGLLDAFRSHYEQFHALLVSVHSEETDPFLLRLLGEDLEEFSRIVNQVFVPVIVSQESHGQRGRPRTVINPDFLSWAYSHRTTSGISQFLGISRATVRRRLLENNIALPGIDPFPSNADSSAYNRQPGSLEGSRTDEILDAQIEAPISLPEEIYAQAASIASNSSSATYLSSISDSQLDALLSQLRVHYCRAGIRMLDGMLRRVGHIVPYERIQHSLLRIDPIHRVFDRIRIRRRGYSVPGPNSLWHHDGHHRQSIHNVRIERLWVDVSHYISQTWHDLFTDLELHHGLDASNINHIWLLQYLFLPTINEHLAFWAEGWNNHRISQRNGPSRSPEDMFGFDMIANGMRGESLDEVAMTDEELEVFGLDWEGLRDETLLRSLRRNYCNEGSGSWLGQRGPPPELNRVVVDPPPGLFTPEQIAHMDEQLLGLGRGPQIEDVVHLWTTALAIARSMSSNDPTLF